MSFQPSEKYVEQVALTEALATDDSAERQEHTEKLARLSCVVLMGITLLCLGGMVTFWIYIFGGG